MPRALLRSGINTPVRTTVVEQPTKYNGTEFTDLTGIEYTQPICRAGRRGKDDIGHTLDYATADMDPDVLLSLGAGEAPSLSCRRFSRLTIRLLTILSEDDYQSARALLAVRSRSSSESAKSRNLR